MIASEPARTDSCVARAFDALAPEYDAAWTSGLIGQFQRRSAWGEMLSVFRAGDRVLELGCGTGADAARLAAAGVRVHATDISPEMLRLAQERLESSGLSSQVTYELIAVEHLGTTRTPGLFDGAFSNFGALNCVEDMRGAAASLARLVRPGGKVLLCFMGRFCLWETAWYLFHLRPAKALRRLRAGRHGIRSDLKPGFPVRVFYHSVREVVAAFRGEFQLVSWRGIGVLVPPSCMERWARARRDGVARLALIEERICAWPVFRGSADHCMLLFSRNPDGSSRPPAFGAGMT